MKLSELKKYVDTALMHPHYGDREVVIKLDTTGMILGTIPNSQVQSVGCGIDWDSNLFIIYPNDILVKKNENRKN